MPMTPASNMDVKRRNRINTLRCILRHDHISQMELSHQLGLSWPTILQNVKELVQLGLIREAGSYESTGGRKAKAYAPVRDAKLALGLDITQNHVSMVLVDLSGYAVRSIRKNAQKNSRKNVYDAEIVSSVLTKPLGTLPPLAAHRRSTFSAL